MEAATKCHRGIDSVTKYNQVRARSLELCHPLGPEDFVPQPVPYTSPPKWHLAHTTWFFEQFVLLAHQPGYEAFHADFSFLFNSYYNHLGERTFRADRGSITRPTVDEVMSYRAHVDRAIEALISTQDDNEALMSLIEVGLNHEEQHQELLITDLKHTFILNPLHPVYKKGFDLCDDTRVEQAWHPLQEGLYEIGHQGPGFCFDNELGRHKVYLEALEIAQDLVTAGEYIAFIEDGAYERFELWLDEGWTWVNAEQVRAPKYWKRIDGQWHRYSLSGLKPVLAHERMSHVNYYEAEAFARWKGCRLPTEFEWEAASEWINWGQRWEWTASAYLPYPRFRTAPGALGEYNGKFMVNQMVLRGASRATAPGHSRSTYRNFFHPQYRWQLSGIRLAREIS